jgi:hypothetical protein
VTIDPRAVTRAAEQLDAALRLTSNASELEVPWLARRAFTKDVIGSTIGDAAEWARSASQELAASGQGVADARGAADELAAQLDAARTGDVLEARTAQPLRDAVDGARSWQSGLARMSEGISALERGSARDWFVRTLAGAEPGPVLAARALADMPATGELGLAQGFLRRLDPSSPRSVELARNALEDGGAAASAALLDDLLASAARGESQDLSLLRDALRGLDDGTGDGLRRLPEWLPDGVTGTRALDAVDIAQLELLRGSEATNALGPQTLSLLAQPFSSLSREQLARIAALTELPATARPHLPASTVDGVDLATAVRRGETPEPQLLKMWAGGFESDAAASDAARRVLDSPPAPDLARRLGALEVERPGSVLGADAPEAWRRARAGGLQQTPD